MELKIIKIGNSNGVRIPSKKLKELNLKQGDKISIEINTNICLLDRVSELLKSGPLTDKQLSEKLNIPVFELALLLKDEKKISRNLQDWTYYLKLC